MKKTTGFYPRVEVDTAGAGVVSQAGGVLLVRAAQVTTLDGELVDGLASWTKPLAVHHAGKVVLDLAMTLAVGGDCLADVAVLRAEPGLFGRVGSDATVSRVVTTLAGDAPKVLRAVKNARAAARARAWRWPGSIPRPPVRVR